MVSLIALTIILNVIIQISGKLLWSDEFNDKVGTKPAEDNWVFNIGDGSSFGTPGWGNSELQYYTNHAKNVATDGNGHLVINALKSKSAYNCYYGPCTYTSARLMLKAAHKYGKIEARIKNPSGKGIWPAFWMLGENYPSVGWPACGGIDVMQMRGSHPEQIFGGLTGPGYSGNQNLTTSITKSEFFDEDFHVYAIDWKPDQVQWMVDDEVYATLTPEDIPKGSLWTFNQPFVMRINLAIGGYFDGYPLKNETFPKSMYIDYVRVYDHSNHKNSTLNSNLINE